MCDQWWASGTKVVASIGSKLVHTVVAHIVDRMCHLGGMFVWAFTTML